MEKEITDFINGKLLQCRDRLINLLLCSSNSRASEFARTWQKLDIAPPAFHHLLASAMGRESQTSESILRPCFAILKFQEAAENFYNGQAVLVLDKLFAIEALIVEIEITPRLIKALGKRGGKKKAENSRENKVASRRYYREKNLVRLTDRAAGKILFSEFPVELRTAESWAAEYKNLAKATDEFADNLSKIFANPASIISGEETDFSSTEVKREAFKSYLEELKNIMGEGFNFPASVNDYADVESYLAVLKTKMLDEGGL